MVGYQFTENKFIKKNNLFHSGDGLSTRAYILLYKNYYDLTTIILSYSVQ